MTFPLMPHMQTPYFAPGALTPVLTITGSLSSHVVSLGAASENRYIVLVMAGNDADAIASWGAPTIDGVPMTQIVQDGLAVDGDGQKGAIWILKDSNKASCTLAGSLPASDFGKVFVLTGVRSPLTSFISTLGSPSANIPAAVPSCCVGYLVTSAGSFTSISNMTTNGIANGFGSVVVGHNPKTTANPTSYTVTATGVAVARFITWPFDY